MDSRAPHYLRFARTLALATTIALPACSDADLPAAGGEGGGANETTEPAEPGAAVSPTAEMIVNAPPMPAAAMDAGTAGDASPGHVSGPLPPPEMPASLA